MSKPQKSNRRFRFLGVSVGIAVATLLATTAYAASPSPAYIPPTADWLTTVNYYRAMAGDAPVTEDPTMSAGATNHSCYMLYNGISHDEVPGLQGYTPEGDLAGNNGNVAVSSVINTSDRSHVELWMTGPFHAIGVLRPNLVTTGFGRCDLPNTPTWHSGATLDVIRGLRSAPRPASPVLFPGNGTTTNLDRFVVETPNPLDFCGWTGAAGLPIIAMMPEAANSASASLKRSERTDRCLRAVGCQHHRSRPADPAGRQRRGDRSSDRVGPGRLQRHRQHVGPYCQLELHRRSGRCRWHRPAARRSAHRRPPGSPRWHPLESSTPAHRWEQHA